jgi:hypothetical protein
MSTGRNLLSQIHVCIFDLFHVVEWSSILQDPHVMDCMGELPIDSVLDATQSPLKGLQFWRNITEISKIAPFSLSPEIFFISVKFIFCSKITPNHTKMILHIL